MTSNNDDSEWEEFKKSVQFLKKKAKFRQDSFSPITLYVKGTQNFYGYEFLQYKIKDKSGKSAICDAQIDLHGMTKQKAYDNLKQFIEIAYNNGLKKLLVITGKGKSNNDRSLLRENLPFWFETEIFAKYISSFSKTPDKHGGEGAFIVKLKNNYK